MESLFDLEGNKLLIDYREDNRWTVYVHIVPKELSGYDHDKYYVGITSCSVEIRWKSDGSGYKKQVFYYAIQKYGWDNIDHEIIANHLTKNEATKLEKTLIKELHSNNKMYGYNYTDGGEGRCGYKLSEDTKRKISKSNKGKIVSEDTKTKIRKNHPDFSYDKNPNSKTVYQFTLDGKFIQKYASISEAHAKTGIDKHSISVASVHSKSAGNFLWIPENNVIKYNDTYTMKEFRYIDKRYISCNKEVYQFDLKGVFITKYPSCSIASKMTGMSRSSISDAARNKYNNPKNYFWRYKKDVRESEENLGSFFIA